jgi:hypothetical protein
MLIKCINTLSFIVTNFKPLNTVLIIVKWTINYQGTFFRKKLFRNVKNDTAAMKKLHFTLTDSCLLFKRAKAYISLHAQVNSYPIVHSL